MSFFFIFKYIFSIKVVRLDTSVYKDHGMKRDALVDITNPIGDNILATFVPMPTTALLLVQTITYTLPYVKPYLLKYILYC